MDLNKHEKTIRAVIDSFRKMCDCIEQSYEIGCRNCPVFNDCFNNGKHNELYLLMEELEIERT